MDELKCLHFGVCSGCTIRGEFLLNTPILQRAKRYFASENITLQGCCIFGVMLQVTNIFNHYLKFSSFGEYHSVAVTCEVGSTAIK